MKGYSTFYLQQLATQTRDTPRLLGIKQSEQGHVTGGAGAGRLVVAMPSFIISTYGCSCSCFCPAAGRALCERSRDPSEDDGSCCLLVLH